MSTHAPGVLPDHVSRDERASSWLIFCDLTVDSPASATLLPAWLQTVTTAVQTLTAGSSDGTDDADGEGSVGDIQPVATCTTAFGRTLIEKAGRSSVLPTGLLQLPAIGDGTLENHDVLFYVLSTSDAAVAQFLRELQVSLAGAGVGGQIRFERGYQRADKHETFGQRDGVRNIAPADRALVAFVGEDQPAEPAWAVGGSYLAYLKIRQDVTTWTGMTPERQAQVIGRQADGTRADLPAGTGVPAEGAFAADTTVPGVTSHVRKAGPRGGEGQDSVRIFRRGTPYIENAIGADGALTGQLEQGLHFVSYQANLDDFDTILNRWMLNPNFPTAVGGAAPGVDQLFDAPKLATIVKGGFYFAVPTGGPYIGAGLFNEPGHHARIAVKLVVQNTAGQVVPTADLQGATFDIATATIEATADGSSPVATVLETLVTNASGHAISGPLLLDPSLTVTQTKAPAGALIADPAVQTVPLTCRSIQVEFRDNQDSSGGQPPYGAPA